MQIASESRANDLYQWTGRGNGTVATAANALNQVATRDGAAFAYDAKGNLTSDGQRSFAYTAENRLASGPGTTLYYDPMGRLVHRSGAGTDFLYDGQDIIQETAPGGAVRRYVHGPGTDEPLVQYEGAGTADKSWLHADERGSIVALSDASGTATAINRYDEYGIPAQGNVGLFQYTGQVWLPELGVYSYKARMYDPELGRFLQPDPIGYGDGMNLYAYVGADPVNFVDPSGLSGTDITVTGRRRPVDIARYLQSAVVSLFNGAARNIVSPTARNDVQDDVANPEIVVTAAKRSRTPPLIKSASTITDGQCQAINAPRVQLLADLPPAAAQRGWTGETIGFNPRLGANAVQTDMLGSVANAAFFFALLRHRVKDVIVLPVPLTDLLISLPSRMTLRVGDDGDARIEVPAYTFSLNVRERIHVRNIKQCPIR